MSSNNWKKYGGINNLDNMKNITANHLVIDTFTVRESANQFTVNGLEVNGDTDMSGNLRVGLNTTTRTLDVSNNAFISNKLLLDKDNDTFLKGLTSNNKKFIGINTITPISTLDIHGNSESTLNVTTTEIKNRNILARNNLDNGIALYVDGSNNTALQFYNDDSVSVNGLSNNGIPEASIKYINNNNVLEIESKDKIKILEKTSFSKRTSSNHLLDETVIIYDTFDNKFYEENYKNTEYNKGNALTLVSEDEKSNTFLNLITPANKKGLLLGGGSHPLHENRSIGIIDVSGNQLDKQSKPAQIIVEGKNDKKYPKTIGFNTFVPKVDNYLLDINGEVNLKLILMG